MSNETLVFHHDARPLLVNGVNALGAADGAFGYDAAHGEYGEMFVRPATERTYGAGRGGSRPEFG